MKIGILGGGQLGRMLALAGIPLGLQFRFLDPGADCCAKDLGEIVTGAFDDESATRQFMDGVDVVTFEFENVPVSTLELVARDIPVYPPPGAARVAQDRLDEKQFFESLGIPTPKYYTIDSAEDLRKAAQEHGEPLIIKTRRFGYDGKGQATLNSADDAEQAWETIGKVPAVAEQRIPFTREVSAIAVRNAQGEIRHYPLAQNDHQGGILHHSRAVVNDPLQQTAQDYIKRVMNELDYVGVMAFEFFDNNGELVANEIAPRVHNSGHWSIEGTVSSQFENHVRAVAGMPLGDTTLRTPSVMYNLIGTMPDRDAVMVLPDVHYHDYGKEPRAGRKLGHITACNPGDETINKLEAILAARKG